MRKNILATMVLLVLGACGDEETVSQQTFELRHDTGGFTIAERRDPIGGLAAPAPPPVLADYKLCCFGSSCSVASGICAFSTWTCTGKEETPRGTVYTGCTCTSHCG